MYYNYITVEGNIGAGKTTLATRLVKEFNGKLITEQFADNPFLPLFYTNRQQYAFPLELFFMAERFQQLNEKVFSSELFKNFTVTDYLFIKSLLFAGVNLNDEEFKLYQRIFKIIYTTLPEPELLVYLHSDIPRLLQNINQRGRDYEKNINSGYLAEIQDAYFNYFKSQQTLRILIIDTTRIDFVNNETHYQQIFSLINKKYDKGVHSFKL